MNWKPHLHTVPPRLLTCFLAGTTTTAVATTTTSEAAIAAAVSSLPSYNRMSSYRSKYLQEKEQKEQQEEGRKKLTSVVDVPLQSGVVVTDDEKTEGAVVEQLLHNLSN